MTEDKVSPPDGGEFMTVRRGGRAEYPYQAVLCTPSGRPHGLYRLMLAEAKDWQGAVNAANRLSVQRQVPLRLWGTE